MVNQSQFANLLTDVARESKRSGEEALNYAMILMLTAGRSATPVGKKNRALRTTSFEDVGGMSDNASFEQVAAATDLIGHRYFEVYRQGQHFPDKIYVPRVRNLKRDTPENAKARAARDAIIKRFREIQYVGTAQASWGWAMWKATGTRGKDLCKRMIRLRDPISVFKQLAGPQQFIECVNALGWIRKLPGCENIEQDMVDSAANRMNAWLEKRWQTGIDAAQRRAS